MNLGELKKFVLPKDFPELDIKSMNIYLVHSRDRILPMLSEESSAKAKKYLEDLGVTVVLNTRVVDIQGDYVQVSTEDDIIDPKATRVFKDLAKSWTEIKGMGHRTTLNVFKDIYNKVTLNETT